MRGRRRHASGGSGRRGRGQNRGRAWRSGPPRRRPLPPATPPRLLCAPRDRARGWAHRSGVPGGRPWSAARWQGSCAPLRRGPGDARAQSESGRLPAGGQGAIRRLGGSWSPGCRAGSTSRRVPASLRRPELCRDGVPREEVVGGVRYEGYAAADRAVTGRAFTQGERHQEGRLPGPVRPHEGDHFTAVQGQRCVAHQRLALAVHREVCRSQYGCVLRFRNGRWAGNARARRRGRRDAGHQARRRRWSTTSRQRVRAAPPGAPPR